MIARTIPIWIALLAAPFAAQGGGSASKHAAREKGAPALIRQRLKAMRAVIAAKKLSFGVGYTSAMDRSPESLGGLRFPPEEELVRQVAEQNEIAEKILKKERRAIEEHEKAAAGGKKPPLPETEVRRAVASAASAAAFDWAALGKVTPVRSQSPCGSCWAFSSCAALESSLLIRHGERVDVSEQYVLDAALHGSCDGGTPAEAFTIMVIEGVPAEAQDPYEGEEGKREFRIDNPYRALVWNFVGNGIAPTPVEIKAALLAFGPVVTGIFSTDLLRAYDGSGVFDAYEVGMPNHLVTIVGWDDTKGAWKIKNSWGTDWADEGFGWIAYGSNGIGYGTAWVEAMPPLKLPEEIREWLKKAQKIAADVEDRARAGVEALRVSLVAAREASERAWQASETAAREAAEKAEAAAKAAESAAKKLADAGKREGRSIDRRTRESLESALAAAKGVEAQARSEAEKAAEAAQKAAEDAAKVAEDAAKAVAEKVPKPKLPKW